ALGVLGVETPARAVIAGAIERYGAVAVEDAPVDVAAGTISPLLEASTVPAGSALVAPHQRVTAHLDGLGLTSVVERGHELFVLEEEGVVGAVGRQGALGTGACDDRRARQRPPETER